MAHVLSSVNGKILQITVITVLTLMRKCTLVLTYADYGFTITYVGSMYMQYKFIVQSLMIDV